jgi:hypothetical protein
MSNFEVFKCNVCNRQTEKLIDQKHAPILKCNVTLKCRGNLIKISQSDTKTLTHRTVEAGLTNWRPRGEGPGPNAQILQGSTTTTINSSLGSLAIGLVSTQANQQAALTIDFTIKKLTAASYTEYFYNRPSGTNLLTGQDDSSKKLTLKFLNHPIDRVIVYVNGVELSYLEYTRDIPGRITFSTPLAADTNQIRVLVFKDDVAEKVSLRFERNDLAMFKSKPTSAWGNVESITVQQNKVYNIFTCYDLSPIAINSQLIFDALHNSFGIVNDLDAYILLADSPYSPFDRNLNNAINLANAKTQYHAISYKKDEVGNSQFFVVLDAIQAMFPPIAILSKSSADVDTNKINSSNTKLASAYIT